MTTRLHRRTDRPAHTNQRYPYDPSHPVVPYAQTQRDVGGAMLIGAIVVGVLMVLIVMGLA